MMYENSESLPSIIQKTLAEGGETGTLIREYDWSTTSLGSIDTWPQSLLTSLSICLNSRFIVAILWGADLRMFYNDLYIPILGKKHPNVLGHPCSEIFSEIWETVGPMLQSVFNNAQSIAASNLLLPINRTGYVEECYFSFSYSPVRGESGNIEGVTVIASEVTEEVISARRLKLLNTLSTQVTKTQGFAETCQSALESLANDQHDMPFALLYRIETDQQQAKLVSLSGIKSATTVSPLTLGLQSSVWPLENLLNSKKPVLVEDLAQRFDNLPTGAWSIAPQQAVLLPIVEAGGQTITAILIVAINPHKKFDKAYADFFILLAHQLAAILTDTLAYEQERKKAQALAEIDKAKTTFFSNVSHEFRTPLTLISGPLIEALNDTQYPLPPVQSERLLLIQRNTQRLLKLVNSLLDFSRIEAKRMQAWYEPTDLAKLTSELTSMFSSAFAKANLIFKLDIQPLSEPVYVDKDMWGKIVFNLLSNALKYTLQGQVLISLKQNQKSAELTVQDTGVGIPKKAISHIFERFYRVDNAQGRSHEGTGIGLALTQSLVKLHGGDIQVNSQENKGSTFSILIPLGIAHLPHDRLNTQQQPSTLTTHAVPFLEESLSWLDSTIPQTGAISPPTERTSARILVIDDNADMRQYLQQLLSPFWTIIFADNGETALTLLSKQTIDVIVSDVMMPKIDGFQLLSILRKDANLQTIPVILLSARAGEEARIEGLQAGATDYLVKPFAPKELVAKIKKQLELAHRRIVVEKQFILQTELEKAQFQKKLQEEFIDTICHEIRNPLNGMYGCVDELNCAITQIELLLKQPDKTLSLAETNIIAQQLKNLKETHTTLNACIEQQKIIVDDVLDLSKLESNSTKLQIEPFNPKQAILTAIQMFQVQIQQKQLNIQYDLCDNFYIDSDKGRFTQIIINLLSNAIKFTAQGNINISLTQQIIESDKTQVEVHVKDTGLGMSEDELKQLFQPFSQANTKIASQFGGSGLGLMISKKLINLMNGDIHVKSKKNQGSDFYFTITAPPALQSVLITEQKTQASLLPTTSIATPSQHILIVEDNIINQKVLKRFLEQAGHTYEIASDGLQALNKHQTNGFDIIFMDIEMPVMNGLEATQQIRLYEQQHQLAHIYIIGLSGNARSEQIATALEAGMDAYMSKPLYKDTLLKHIDQAISAKHSLQKILSSSPPPLKPIDAPVLASSRFFNTSVNTEDEMYYLTKFKDIAKEMLEQHYPFIIYSQNLQLTITLLPQLPKWPIFYCKLILKEFKSILETVFSQLSFLEIISSSNQLQINFHSKDQLKLLQTVLLKTGFEVTTHSIEQSAKPLIKM
jgi:signal transduction histidine kinase